MATVASSVIKGLSKLFGFASDFKSGHENSANFNNDIDSWIDQGSLFDSYYIYDIAGTLNNVSVSNRHLVIGWNNATGKYAWILIIDFSNIKYGKRPGANTFTFSTIV